MQCHTISYIRECFDLTPFAREAERVATAEPAEAQIGRHDLLPWFSTVSIHFNYPLNSHRLSVHKVLLQSVHSRGKAGN